jgi:hypothetical protein
MTATEHQLRAVKKRPAFEAQARAAQRRTHPPPAVDSSRFSGRGCGRRSGAVICCIAVSP